MIITSRNSAGTFPVLRILLNACSSVARDSSPAASSRDLEILEDSDETEVDTPILWEVRAVFHTFMWTTDSLHSLFCSSI